MRRMLLILISIQMMFMGQSERALEVQEVGFGEGFGGFWGEFG